MNRNHGPTCYCHTCRRWFDPLGIASHRAMHRRKREDCTIMFTAGDTYTWKYSELSEAEALRRTGKGCREKADAQVADG